MGYNVLLFVPNVIGYFRLCLFGASLPFFSQPGCFLALYGTSVALDGFDGYFARKLNQTSRFGAWFDIVIDLISRGGLWCLLYKYGYFMIIVEWLTFTATHTRGANWKIPDEEFPYLCKLVMAKGFKTPLGFIAISGVHGLPIALYCQQSDFLQLFPIMTPTVLYTVIVFLILGRIIAFRVEIFYIQSHIKGLLLEEENS
ncbi:CDP-diacylglycerol--inositol 3-phosphatidyltransferase-like [Saccostrea echinata]|uniref:CDP-diacylglycerol--inositol 3-phosphatidyltransferase-like n=1 Tax=Saccostrea echinata TaxID=191078 RepID=UPI002A83B7DD|nr:CDP-diacylglycerol--inositol 3-phosphatidyltransferase-like [Saccostrea echinata]